MLEKGKKKPTKATIKFLSLNEIKKILAKNIEKYYKKII